MSSATRTVVEDFFRHVGAGELEDALALLAEPLDWFTPGDTTLIPWMGRRTTRDEVRFFFQAAGEHMTPQSFEVHRVVVEDDAAIALGHFKYVVDATGKAFASDFALELRVTDGLIDRYRMHEDSYTIALAFQP
ncbi:nuclear transport factor 2 family protein [Kitasatospora mediocidica]|uniref:nuclear transport factor 2 family protein n=1 Tax=Kitasatospora mediocidica TaxID=58352 RepID=UPI00056BBC32|nr:nuclear transport factor 2 family protein [Kitasatospora mediocidica]